MRIAICTLYYPPATEATAALASTIVTGFAKSGHDVTVYSGTAGSALQTDLSAVVVEVGSAGAHRKERLSDRVARYLRFALGLRRALERSNAEVALVFTPPPLIPLFVHRHRPVVYSIQDLYPEIIGHSRLPARELVAAAVAPLEFWAQRRADRCIVLGPRIADRLATRVPRHRINTIPNPLLLSEPQESELVVDWREIFGTAGPVVIYSGNVGLTQDWDLVLDLGQRLERDGALVAVVGLGARSRWLESEIARRRLRNVRRLEPWPASQVRALLRSAAAALVPLRPGVASFLMPSKIAAYMSAGCPIVATAEPTTDLAEVILGSGAGAVAMPGDIDSVHRAVRTYLGNDEVRGQAAARGRAYVTKHFDPQHAVDRYLEVCAKAIGSRHEK